MSFLNKTTAVKGVSRRGFLRLGATGAVGLAASTALALPSGSFQVADLRGTLNASTHGVKPHPSSDQSDALQSAINKAAKDGKVLFLPAGRYVVRQLNLPSNTAICGVPGQTQLVYQGTGTLLAAHGATRVSLEDLVLDGGKRPISEQYRGLVDLTRVDELRLRGLTLLGSSRSAISAISSNGEISGCSISGAAHAGIWSMEANGLSILDNVIHDCGNGGILVHRWTKGPDGTHVRGNRIDRIAARDGGTGQNGNGINIFRADNVIVADNSVSDCAFSAIRGNSASNLHIRGNTCLRSGEVAVFSEFAFDGAIITNNIIDGAALGISITNLDHGGRTCVCTGNIIRNLVNKAPYEPEGLDFGIGIQAEADTTVTGNVIENAETIGIVVGWGPYMRNVIASQNIIRETPMGIAVSVAPGAGGAVLTQNVFDGVTEGGIVAHEWTKPVSGDLAHEGAEEWPRLLIRDNQLIVGQRA
ncbi:TIGR03808 family TAT-translocated repetitive protein [Pseudovibrio exalbescens]|uniref:TIGR03808 family TAT-translocated repetitive protein n=1 Tax=Pseudovibrio exalbescens TaxID=197461 RepID=UPI0023660FF8|nr:TIGR03808 family TAT-translocated repetitive protein [Pseudovibrio exalbescens]MDD7909202.1 TIGR03808 family TAT-translocated repetitive protein [Pseudovibrio exalbescens]